MKNRTLIVILTFLCLNLPAFADLNEELLEAVNNGDLPEVRRLIDAGVNINASGAYNRTALITAASGGYMEIYLTLIGFPHHAAC